MLNLLLEQPSCMVSLHRPDLMQRFQRVLGLRQGELVLDASPSAITDNPGMALQRGLTPAPALMARLNAGFAAS